MKTVSYMIAATVLLLCVSTLYAEELNYNIIHLYGNAEKQIDSDIMVVTMSAVAEEDTAREAALAVNNDMAWATNLLEGTTNIKSRTMNYQTRPRYKNKTIIGWSANQQIRLESEKIEELSGIVGKLQERLAVVAMRFEVSPMRQKTAVNELISHALEDFRAKAQLVTTTIGAKDYRIVTITIGENNPPAPHNRAYQMEAMSVSRSSAPSVEAGESKVSVRAEGSVQLIF